jgi:phosphotransferase system enzyme I (PtsP)
LSPAVLTVLREVVRAADAAGVTCSICGEMAGRPLEAMALIALGYRSLSMSPGGIGPVKAMLRSMDVGIVRSYLDPLLAGSPRTLRCKLRNFAIDHGIAIS